MSTLVFHKMLNIFFRDRFSQVEYVFIETSYAYACSLNKDISLDSQVIVCLLLFSHWTPVSLFIFREFQHSHKSRPILHFCDNSNITTHCLISLVLFCFARVATNLMTTMIVKFFWRKIS